MEPANSDETCRMALSNLLAGLPGVHEGKMFGFPAFFVGQKLFACVYGDVVGFKVAEETAVKLLEDPRFAPFQPRGRRKMREWVQFRCSPHEEIDSYEQLLLASYEYVGGGGKI
jgi:TfoX/Sxy family transcriptional regulator of competence genes